MVEIHEIVQHQLRRVPSITRVQGERGEESSESFYRVIDHSALRDTIDMYRPRPRDPWKLFCDVLWLHGMLNGPDEPVPALPEALQERHDKDPDWLAAFCAKVGVIGACAS